MQGAREEDRREDIGIWSLGWGQDGQTIIAGTNNESVYVYDANVRRVRCPCCDKQLFSLASTGALACCMPAF